MPDYLICRTKLSLPLPPVPSDSVNCCKCGKALWRAKSSPSDMETICIDCVPEQGESVLVMTKAQLADVKRYSRNQQSN